MKIFRSTIKIFGGILAIYATLNSACIEGTNSYFSNTISISQNSVIAVNWEEEDPEEPEDPPAIVVLNEIMPKPEDGSEWVEFFNLGEKEADLSNWQISERTSSGNENKYVISSLDVFAGPDDYKIPPGGFLAVKFSGSKLNDSGDTVTLYDPEDNIVDSHTYIASDVSEGKSIARIPDGTGEWIDPISTPGKPNKLDDENDSKNKSEEDEKKEEEKIDGTQEGEVPTAKTENNEGEVVDEVLPETQKDAGVVEEQAEVD